MSCTTPKWKAMSWFIMKRDVRTAPIWQGTHFQYFLKNLWLKTVMQIINREWRDLRTDETEMDIYHRLSFEIVDHSLRETEQRFSSFNKLEFFHLLYARTVLTLLSIYGPQWNNVSLKTELIVLHSSLELSLKNVHKYEVVSLINEYDLISRINFDTDNSMYCIYSGTIFLSS